jgi:hypothetical protein
MHTHTTEQETVHIQQNHPNDTYYKQPDIARHSCSSSTSFLDKKEYLFLYYLVDMKKTAPKKKKLVTKRPTTRVKPVHLGIGMAVLIVAIVFITVTHFFNRETQASSARSLVALLHRPSKPVCGLPGVGKAHCHAHVITTSTGTPLATSSPYSSSFGPSQFHTAYNLPCTPKGSVQTTCPQPTSFGSQTIAIVDAYNDPTIENDLNVYSSYYGIPSCTKANGCLSIVNQNGSSTLPTTTDSGWALETSMDVEVAHAMCQTCKIVLVETNTNGMNDLATGVNTAATLGATAISNSYGGSEWSGEVNYDSSFTHPGVAVTASAGDNGYGTAYPAAAQGIVAVGGTTLQLYSDNTYASETVWNGTGSGCSLYEAAPNWQTALPNWSQTGCGSKRAIGDVAADADPNTGAAVYDSTPYSGSTGWYQVGGTSLSSPLIASTFALTGGMSSTTTAASLPYANFTTTNSHDVQSGTNGSCSTTMCTAVLGYDGPTGLGTPNGVSGFMTPATPTPTPTLMQPTPTLAQPTPTPTPKLKHGRHV